MSATPPPLHVEIVFRQHCPCWSHGALLVQGSLSRAQNTTRESSRGSSQHLPDELAPRPLSGARKRSAKGLGQAMKAQLHAHRVLSLLFAAPDISPGLGRPACPVARKSVTSFRKGDLVTAVTKIGSRPGNGTMLRLKPLMVEHSTANNTPSPLPSCQWYSCRVQDGISV